jgi:hypothetical protein
MIDHQITEMINRDIKVNNGEDTMPPLPSVELRKNQQAVFNNSGDLVAGGAVIGTIISPFMIPVVTAPTLPAARDAMGVAPIDSPIFTGNPQARRRRLPMTIQQLLLQHTFKELDQHLEFLFLLAR